MDGITNSKLLAYLLFVTETYLLSRFLHDIHGGNGEVILNPTPHGWRNSIKIVEIEQGNSTILCWHYLFASANEEYVKTYNTISILDHFCVGNI